jgi:hypothetical protein
MHCLGCFDCDYFIQGNFFVILAACVVLEKGDGFGVQAPVMSFALM